ncbi:hypothetical protein [Flagellimonas sp.]|uniref:hypothetical protein n=1 Tax=Flagellimonas sp. TaxID=2058762 RepID=UPI003BAD128A
MLVAASAAGTTAGASSGFLNIATKLAPMFSKLISGEVFSRTLGQIKDGFDCWGSTWTPSRARAELPGWMEQIALGLQDAMSVSDSQLEQSINRFFADGLWDTRLTGGPLEGSFGWRYDSAKDCTLRGLKELEQGIDAYIVEMATTVTQSLKELGFKVSYVNKSVTLYRDGVRSKPYQKRVPQFTISKPLLSSVLPSTTSPQKAGIGIFLVIAAILFGMKKFK